MECANCPLRIEIIQIKDWQDKFENEHSALSKTQTETLIWQAKIDQKFIAVENGIARIEKAIDSRLKPVEDGINAIKDKPIKRLDAVTTAGIVVFMTAFINLGIRFATHTP
jgi:hypothetical protein